MVTRIGGSRRKTRYRLKKDYRRKSKISLKIYFQQFKKGDKVVIQPESAHQKSLCHKRYFSKMAVVNKKQGRCYEVIVLVNKNPRKIIIHPIHLAKA
ncbi:hypothetical protein KY306_00060 [Candidatus Woesearchaeota archaeon]|nr:hypothetical protein [Candidatus Woesearchaeota archaeon]